MLMTESGQDILDQANASWNAKKNRYTGLGYVVSVGCAKQQIEKHRGGNKDRKAEAQHWVDVTFTHARTQGAARLEAVAMQASAVASGAMAFGSDGASEFRDFATEVANKVNGLLGGVYGIIDIITLLPLIMNMIQAIVAAIQQCKANKKPIPAPVPAP